MTHECSVELLEAVDGLVRERVEPCSDEASKGGWEHDAFGEASSTVKIQGGLEVKDVIMASIISSYLSREIFRLEGTIFF